MGKKNLSSIFSEELFLQLSCVHRVHGTPIIATLGSEFMSQVWYSHPLHTASATVTTTDEASWFWSM